MLELFLWGKSQQMFSFLLLLSMLSSEITFASFFLSYRKLSCFCAGVITENLPLYCSQMKLVQSTILKLSHPLLNLNFNISHDKLSHLTSMAQKVLPEIPLLPSE